MKRIIILDVVNSGERLDHFLTRSMEGVTRAEVQKLIRDGMVTIEDAGLKKSYPVQAGERIKVKLGAVKDPGVHPEPLRIELLYEDEDLAVVNKPRGMVVHPAPGHVGGTLVNALLYRYDRLSSVGGAFRPGIVHRLDKDTSGLLMIARNDEVHRNLARQFKARTVRRVYLAAVWGKVAPGHMIISAPLGRDPRNRKKIAVQEGGREAISHVYPLCNFQDSSLLRVELKTGRTHQIRAHMSHLGYPLVGDPLYGGKNKKLDLIGWKGQALHARLLELAHPRTGEKMRFVAPLPPEFKRLLNLLRDESQL